MVFVDLKSITQPVGIIRIMAVIITCLCFSLVASAKPENSPYWAWCMFTWCFCCFFTLLIIILEFTTVSSKMLFDWNDFTAAFAILASLICLSASIIYPIFFTCNTCHRQAGASAVSWVCFGVYVGEVVLTYLRPHGQTRGFLSTLPGIMKMLESFLACLIFMSLEKGQYHKSPELQWCVAVYALCFTFTIILILLTLGDLTSYFPFSFDITVIVFNVLATAMYLTALVLWPLYSLHNHGRPSSCGRVCSWDKLVLITIITIFNFIIYTMDTVYSVIMVFSGRNQ
nr:myeloid-associated differentiation marker [Nothobranchius furzeri]